MAKRASSGGIKTFTSTGRTISGVQRAGVLPASLGSVDPDTGKIYQKPRPKLNEIEGSSVEVINPKALDTTRRRRGPSLGMGGVGANTRQE